ncbi:dihydroxy-acid dehydratase, partial [Streptomyces sp. DH12]|uniref:DUF2786 domain-containing protein n=1 Tax=Streptomyces sp. DH12 TaxID=2857010 RepID=UPI001E386C68
PHLLTHRGPARVFDSPEAYHAVADDPALDVDENTVIVIRNAGPKGYPGMPEVSNVPLPAKLLKAGVTDMVRVCDGRMSGTGYGTVVLHVAPEAAVGGPLALVRDGDPVVLDVPGRTLRLDVDDAELARRGEDFVASAWQRGWQPADVVRVVRRELDETHVRLAGALIRAQARRDGRARGARWEAQLEELPEAEGFAPRGDRFSHVTAVLELYRLLLRLPPLEPLDEAAAPSPAGRERRPESRMLGRIRALLAKAEATGFPEEAEALSAKAQELMARHSVDEALLAAPSAP